jgi:regulatory protein
MPRSPWPRRKRSTKPDGSVVGAPSGATDATDAPTSASTDPLALGSDPGDDPPAKRPSIRKIALDILARREHSVAELREKLAARAFDADEIQAAIEALTRDGLLSEDRFLENFVGSYTRRGHGPVWIRAELERRGISGDAIREALESADIDWDAAAEAVRVKRFGPAVPTDFKERARQARFLQYRGFKK